jgi:glutamine synthetase
MSGPKPLRGSISLDEIRSSSRTVQLEFPDLDGGLRAKLVSTEKAFSPSGSAMCAIMFGLTVADDVFDTPVSSAENGYPDLIAVADLATLRTLPWTDSTAAVICDLLGSDRQPCEVAPRTVLARVIQRFTELGIEPHIGVEWELCVVRRDDALMAQGRHGELNPLGRTPNAYSSLRLGELRPLADAFLDRMDAIGIRIDSMHSELGHGMFEIAMTHAPAMEAADAAVRVKTYFKELCGERDLVATFMPRWRSGAPTTGCHFHQSLWRDGGNAFADGDGLSVLGRSFLAGQLETMRDMTLLLNPTVNSYRRLQPGNFTPTTASWGVDNRTTAIRLILGSPSSIRLEHRRAGADVNPYLAIAAMLAGGLYGVQKELTPPKAADGDASSDARFASLPASLREAVEVFEGSDLIRQLLSEPFAEHFSLSRRAELENWERWEASEVTEWEYRRYFERT